MRAKIIHRNGILLAAMVTLLSLAHATPAATNAEFVLFDRQFDLKNITTQDATISESNAASSPGLRIITGQRLQWPGITLRAPGGHWDLSNYGLVAVTLRSAGANGGCSAP